MGSHLFHAMPRTGGYTRVIALLGDSAGGGGAAGVGPGSLEQIAAATLDAALDGLQLARGDAGLAYTWYLIVEVVRAAGATAFLPALEAVGIRTPAAISGLPDIPVVTDAGRYSVYDLAGGFAAAVDRRLARDRTRTDISEVGQLAAAESLSGLLSTVELFADADAAGRTVRERLRAFGSERGFGALANDFFAKLVRRFLEYHLSRELSNHVGPARRFRDVDEHDEFLRQLDRHCFVCAQVVRPFAGQWLRKRLRQDDHTVARAGGFVGHALGLVRGAVAFQEGRDATT